MRGKLNLHTHIIIPEMKPVAIATLRDFRTIFGGALYLEELLFYSHAFSEVAGFIDVVAADDGGVVSQ